MNVSKLVDSPAKAVIHPPRFSLLSLLLLVAILALSITVTRLWREVGPLRTENKRLNEERGTLMVDDSSRLHAIRIPDRFAGEGRESYRIFVPKDSLYWAFVVVNNIPKEGYPKLKRYPDRYSILGMGTNLPLHAKLEPGEHVLTLRKVRRGDDRWDVQLAISGIDATAHTPADDWPTIEPDTYSVFESGVKLETTPADSSRRLVLLRRRIEAVVESRVFHSYSTPEPDYPLDGLILWIEPDPGQSKSGNKTPQFNHE
jgi:hypothetical protein